MHGENKLPVSHQTASE